jgi:hypothetical protein
MTALYPSVEMTDVCVRSRDTILTLDLVSCGRGSMTPCVWDCHCGVWVLLSSSRGTGIAIGHGIAIGNGMPSRVRACEAPI